MSSPGNGEGDVEVSTANRRLGRGSASPAMPTPAGSTWIPKICIASNRSATS